MSIHRFHDLGALWANALSVACLVALATFMGPIDLSAAPMAILQAQVFVASNQPGVVPDPRLAGLIGELRKALPYSSFQLLGAPSGRAAIGQSWRTELPGGRVPGGRVLELTPTAIDRGAIQVQARVIEAKIVQERSASEVLVNTSLRLQNQGPPVVIGGPPHGSGVLIIVISASAP